MEISSNHLCDSWSCGKYDLRSVQKELPEEELNDGEPKKIEEKYSLVQAFKLLIKNKYYIMICGTYILQQLYSAMIGAGLFYMTWVLKNKNLFGQFAWAVNIPSL